MKPRIVARRRRQRGSILVLTAVMITGMIGMLALSIDLGILFSGRNQFQNGIDAAALAGATGLRASIEPDAAMPQQSSIVKALAVQYAGFNQVKRFAEPDPNSGQPNNNKLVLDPANVSVDIGMDIPRVEITTSMEMPLFFASIFGFDRMTMNATSRASLFPVDGGTGGVGACWRPLFLPDTFFDSSNVVQYVGGRLTFPMPDQSGDYYRSRFAVGARNVAPFVDSLSGLGNSATGLRDTQSSTEIGVKTIMGMNIVIPRDYYRIANFQGLPRATFDALSTGDLANFGYCGQIRVGDDIPVYQTTNIAIYDSVRVGLESLKGRTSDAIDTALRDSYKYIKSASYPDANTHGAIIPVLLFNPIELVRNPGNGVLRVTNIGLFFLDSVTVDGTLSGFFVREIITGGTPISATNFASDTDPTFKRSWLPMSAQLLK